MPRRIGLLSDSHGRASTTQKGADALVAAGAELLIHLGDVGTVEVLDALCVVGADGVQLPAHVVFGNTDWDQDGLASYAADLDLVVDHPLGRIATGRGDLVFCHGHEPQRIEPALAETPPPAYVCSGHTHKVADVQDGPTRLLNPGALFRASAYTVGLLDVDGDSWRVLQV